jgi:hypothetical protein
VASEDGSLMAVDRLDVSEASVLLISEPPVGREPPTASLESRTFRMRKHFFSGRVYTADFGYHYLSR